MDFCKILTSINEKTQKIIIYPDFIVGRSKDLMIRGRSFYAIWNEQTGMWSRDEYDVIKLIDIELWNEYEKVKTKFPNYKINVKTLSEFSTNTWGKFQSLVKLMPDTFFELDSKIVFKNDYPKKEDYISHKLSYEFKKGECPSYEKIISTLYLPEERRKIEWAIGSIISGDSKSIQKFVVLYGEAESGKSTILNIIQKLFDGYCTTFDAKALTSNSNAFSTEVFKDNPLVVIQHDGDLSRVEDNTKLNSIVSHEDMTMNEKWKASYTGKTNCFIFVGSNSPVKITNSKSGLIRRLIDVNPSLIRLPVNEYNYLVSQLDFELGAIAYHCLEIYKKLGMHYYSKYRPIGMMFQTDTFFNFVENFYLEFKNSDSITLTRAYDMYKSYCEESLVEYKLPRHKFREELKSYFKSFQDVGRIDDKQVRSVYSGFKLEKFFYQQEADKVESWIKLEETVSVFDNVCSELQAQYASDSGAPSIKWVNCTTKLKDIDSSKIHYVNIVDVSHIVVDFDIKGPDGNKSLKLNVEAASKWPKTYCELSKSGKGVHLHYFYNGDTKRLKNVYDENIEIKTFHGGSALRRKLTHCNNLEIFTINGGLPLKGENVIDFKVCKTEKAIRSLIEKNLRKEIHPGTKSSIDFIFKILNDAYSDGIIYDVTNLRQKILIFAAKSTNNASYCLDLVSKMKFMSELQSEEKESVFVDDEDLVFFDVEVFPNLFVIVWKKNGGEKNIIYNPTSKDVEKLLSHPLVGYNCRRYDNHILYASYIGHTNYELYELSQKIIGNSKNATFRDAYNLSYADMYDISSKKQSLKKFEIDLGIIHKELDMPWDQEVPEDRWEEVGEYCGIDVDALESVFNNRHQDYVARKILCEMSGLTPNNTTMQHASKILFGGDKEAKKHFVYTDLSEEFPGYKFESGVSSYLGEDPSEGGYVFVDKGIYYNVPVLDVTSLHPTSAIILNIFGPYTKKYEEILKLRISVKNKDIDAINKFMGGMLSQYVKSDEDLKNLAYALKIIINSIYGFTSAKFDNPFNDPRNKDNIVAKRGALFMINLKKAAMERNYNVVHIKTDSIKISDGDEEAIEFIKEYGKKYGYGFEHEDTYEKICIVNAADYIGYSNKKWTAVGARFSHPYVYKTLFSKDPIGFLDLCETKSVTSAMYLRHGDEDPEYRFVGKTGLFCPIKDLKIGGVLCRKKDNKYYSVTGAKGYLWAEAAVVKELGIESLIDMSYFESLAEEAKGLISEFGDFDMFANATEQDEYPIGFNDIPNNGEDPCGKSVNCQYCDFFVSGDFKYFETNNCACGYNPDNLYPF